MNVENIHAKPNKMQVECWNHLQKKEDLILQGGTKIGSSLKNKKSKKIGKSFIQIVYLVSMIDCSLSVDTTCASIT